MTRKAKTRAYRKGLLAEWLALFWLILKGYRPVAWRYKTPVGEIDLIMQTRSTIVFVEVKARRSTADAFAAISITNQQRVARAAQYYLHAHPEHVNRELRLDAVAVPWYGLPHHMRNAFHHSAAH